MLDEEQVREALGRFLEVRDPTAPRPTEVGHPDLEPGRRYLRESSAGGWALPTWPVEFGGRGADRDQARMITRVRREFAVPDLYPFMTGIFLVGPTLLEWGTDEQRRRWLPTIARGEEIWCQMFSEPDAGSDLANLGTRCDRDGDEWVLSGQKVWTSRAAYADWAICLARYDGSVPKHQGITAFFVPMDAPGVHVRPLVQMNGDDHFSEVFLDGVRVPDGNRFGEVGAGWRIALTVLGHERGLGDGGAGRTQRARPKRPRWLDALVADGAIDDPAARDEAMQIYVRESVLRYATQRVAALARAGRPGPYGSGLKWLRSELDQDKAYFVTRAAGPAGMLTDHRGYLDTVTAPSLSIRGGTDQIQRNIIGEKVLDLPREPRSDLDVPWSASRAGR